MTATMEFLDASRISRSAHAVRYAQQTSFYMAVCETHQRPIRVELAGEVAQFAFIDCPVGGEPIKAERLVAKITRLECEGACMGATTKSCDCGCGGYNHGRAWGTELANTQVFESALTKFRVQRARVERKRQERAEAAERKAAKVWAEFAREHANVVAYLSRLDRAELGGFLFDMTGKVLRQEVLSENMWRAVERIMGQEMVKRQREAERAAAAKPVPTGKDIKVTGRIVKVKCQEGYLRDSVEIKATVAGDGWAVWVTLPRAVETWARDTRRDVIIPRDMPRYRSGPDFEGASQRWTEALRDLEISFTAEIGPSERDASFGFAKRPKQVTWSH
jgi:hypothetical protein